jgi:lipopolysaccharide export system permease protein
MFIVDRYLLRQFMGTFSICLCSLTGIFIVFDAFANLEAFLRCAKGTQVLKLMGWYYGFQSILFFDRFSSLLVLMSAMFTVAWIQRHHEMTALMAAGISRVRIVSPVIAAAIAITTISVISREAVIPRCKEQLVKRPSDLQANVAEEMAPQYDQETDVLIRGKCTYPDQKRIEKPDFLLPAALSKYGRQLQAENAYYCPPTVKRPGGYLLDGFQEPKELVQHQALQLGGKPVIITPPAAPDWLKPGQCFVVSEVTFEELSLNGGRALRKLASTAELIRGLRNRSADFGADLRVAIHARIVQPLLDITLLFLGLPLVVSRESRNVFIAIGLCMGVVTFFLLLALGFQQLGTTCLISPALAAWAPLILFVPVATGLAESMWRR